MSDEPSRGPRKKIIRVSEEYGLDDIGSKLAEFWVRPDEDDRPTLVELRDHFNQEVLRAAMDEAGMEIAPGAVEYTYKYLFYDDAPESDRETTRRRLEDGGVDVDDLQDDFVNSSQTVHNYLQQVHDVDSYREEDDRSVKEKSLDNIQGLTRRYETIAEETIDRLVETGEIPNSEYDIRVDCIVTNTETGESQSIQDMLQ